MVWIVDVKVFWPGDGKVRAALVPALRACHMLLLPPHVHTRVSCNYENAQFFAELVDTSIESR
jgi:hypothetical protein